MKVLPCVAALMLFACASNGVEPLRPLEIATAPYQGIATTALSGSLMYEGGCLLFRGDGDRLHLFPVWPHGSTFNGNSLIFHEPGKADQHVAIGEEFLMAGQPVDWARVPNPRIALYQQRCGATPFAVLHVRPAN